MSNPVDRNRIIESMKWMLETLQWLYLENLGFSDIQIEEIINTRGQIQVNWSPEMREAMDVFEGLKRE